MTTFYELPLSPMPQTFLTNLSGVEYRLTLQYRNTDIAGGEGWTLDIADQFSNPIVCGIPLVTGANLLAQYQYLGFPASTVAVLAARSDGNPDDVPTFWNLGIGSHLFWITT